MPPVPSPVPAGTEREDACTHRWAAWSVEGVEEPSYIWRLCRKCQADERRPIAAVVSSSPATPPGGWFYFGSHVDQASWLALEFSDALDDCGDPLWERPVPSPATPPECETCAAAPRGFAEGLALWHASGHAHLDRTGVHAETEAYQDCAYALRALLNPTPEDKP